MIRKISIFFCVFFAIGLQGQDLHFTLFDLAPHNVNPALTGAYEGTFRIGGIFRDQYFAANDQKGSEPFLTASIYADGNVLRGFRKKDWIAVGINFAQDLESGSIWKNQFQNLSLAYHIGIGKKSNSIFTIGAQYGLFNRQIQNEGIKFYENVATGIQNQAELLGSLGGGNQDENGNFSNSYSDVAAGLLYSTYGKNSDFKIGLTVTHILRPSQAVFNSRNDDKSIGYIGFAQLVSRMGKKTSFMPSIIFQKDGLYTNTNLQAKFGYILNPKKGIQLNAGLGYRLGEAAQLLFGVDYKNIRAGLGYDFVAGGIRNAARETFEFGISYIFRIAKKPELRPRIFCPRL